MIDFANVVSCDPPAVVGWLVFSFAAGMYPFGFLFGVCSACCQQLPCDIDLTVTDEVSVVLSAENVLFQQTREYDVVTMKISQAGDMSHLDGTHVLDEIGAFGGYVRWEKSVASPTTNCPDVLIQLDLAPNPATSNLVVWILRISNIRMPSRAEYGFANLGCPAPQYHDTQSLTACQVAIADPCVQDLIAVTATQSFTATCDSEQEPPIINVPPYGLTVGVAGHTIGSDWTLIGVTTDANNLATAIVVDDVFIRDADGELLI